MALPITTTTAYLSRTLLTIAKLPNMVYSITAVRLN